MKTKSTLSILLISIFALSAMSCLLPKSKTNSANKPKETPEKVKPSLSITKSIVRIGERNIAKSLDSGFDFEVYNGSALTKVENTIENYKDGEIIKVPFKSDVEVELQFDPLEIQESGMIGGSYFQVIPDPKESTSPQDVRSGKVQSWKIENNKAIAYSSVWVHAPYNNGGTVKLKLYLETKTREKFEKEWTFQILTSEDKPKK